MVPFLAFAGSLSDRIGRRPLCAAGGLLMALWAFPFFWLINTGDILLIGLAMLVGSFAQSLTYAPLAAFLGELFEPRIRYSGMSLAYQLAAILISGGTPFIMTALLAATDTTLSVSAYLAFLAVLTFIGALMLRETHKPSEKGARVQAAAQAGREGEEKEKHFQPGPASDVEAPATAGRFTRDEAGATNAHRVEREAGTRR
jgi:MFS family permease